MKEYMPSTNIFIKFIVLLHCASLIECAANDCDKGLCTTCITPGPAGTAFQCSTCQNSPSTTIILSNVCLPNCPYGFATSPSCTLNTNAVVNVVFDQPLFSGSYGPFITATSSTTYQFFVNPEGSDPSPSYQQGLYFSGGDYLSTTATFYPNYQVAFCLWYKSASTNNDLLYINPANGHELIRVNADGGLRLYFEDKPGNQQGTINTNNNPNTGNGVWWFLSYTISYSSSTGDTTYAQYLNTVVDKSATVANQLLRNSGAGTQTLIIGKGPGSGGFNGWVYNFKFWNTNYSGWATEYSTVCGSGTNSCFINCGYGKYWSGSSCITCATQCTNGCSGANKCNCYDPLCAACTGWASGLCTTCTTNASGGGATACSCNPGSYSSDGFTCTSCPTGCATCTGGSYYQCGSCLSGYYFLTTMCLSSCPAGYTQDSTNNICTISTSTALSIAFQNQIILNTLSGVTVGSSNANSYPTWESTDPIPSIYRGYYFTSTYYMTLSSVLISPYFSITMWIYPTAQGNVVTKFSTFNLFLLTITSSGYPSLQLKLSDASTVTVAGSSSNLNGWHNIAFTGTINASGKTVISLYVDGSSVTSTTSTNASPFIDAGTLYIGRQSSSNGFTGFLWSLKIYNDNTLYNNEWKTTGCASGCSTCPSELLCPSTCTFGTFLNAGSCTACGSCSTYGCRSTDTCRLCKNKECTTCTLFDGPCTACITNASLSGGVCSCNSNAFWVASTATCEICDALVSTCTGTYYFLGSACSGSAVLVGNVCLNACPYGFATSPCTSVSTTVIDQTFDTSFLGTYGIFTTSTSATTYQFWNSPDSLDPIPAYKRGLYFTGGQYLVSNTNIYLSNSVSMGLWIYVITAGDVLQKQTRLSLSSAGVVTAALENPSQTTTSASTTALSAFSGWTYLSFTITYTSGATTMTAYKNGAAGITLSNTAYLYRDAASNVLYLGKSSTSSTFVGFIYYFSLWNAAITDFSSKFTIPCGTSLVTSCLWSCTISQYYATSLCTSCNSCGNLGCRQAVSCNICSDPLCAQCTGFSVNLCTLCVTHASGGSMTPCSCDTNYVAAADGFSCIWACTTGCAGCSGTGYYQCTSCLISYYYLNGLCLTSCPTGYTQDSTNHLCTLSSSTPVSLALQDWIKLDATSGFTVGSSSSNAYPSWTDSADPVPSIYRGYYFTSSSLMSLSSLIITPFYTVTMWIKPTAQGNLFLKLNGANEMLKIVFTSSGWPTITLKLADGTTVNLNGTVSLFNGWHNIAFTGDIVSGNTKIYFYTDGVLKSNQVSSSVSQFTDLGTLYLGFSNAASGFTGFLWNLKIFNENTHSLDEWITSGCPSGCSTCPSDLICPDNCAFGSFLSSGSCTACSGSCSPYGCRSTETCRLCQYRECTTCTKFDGPCTACITNAGLSGGVCSCNSNAFWVASTATCELCDALCSTCTGTYYFLCSACSGSAVLVGNVCLNACPYGFATSPCTSVSTTVIDQTFDTSFVGSYGIFTTSTSATTYQFWNTPDTLDPIPAYKRGLYFTGGQYLVSNTNIYLSNSVSMGLWIYVITAGDVLQKQTRLSLSSAGVVTATLENPSQTTTSASTTALSAFTGWTYLSFTITYTSGATTMTAYKNGAAGTTLSNAAYLYRDAASDILYLGKSSTSSTFVGFIYYFSLWNTAITDFSSKFTIPCGTSLDTSCLWSCTISQYYTTSSCTSCNSCGNLGCRQAVSCNICYDPLCAQCTGFGVNLCTLCVTHASGGSTTPCSCDTNYVAAADGFSCIWACATGCAGCSGASYYQCTSCLTSYYYLNGLCLTACPTGYTQDSTNRQCTISSTTPVSLVLEDWIKLDTTSGFTVGSSSSNAYPSWTDSADPVPSIYRGYYFTSSSLMSLSSLLITPFYTVTMWVKPTAQGNLFLKLNGANEMFKIVFTSSGWPTITLKLADGTTVNLSGTVSLFNGWHNIAFTGDIVSGNTKIYFYTDGVLKSNQVSSSVSQFTDSGTLYLGYSNSASGFTGFLWSLKIFNGNTHSLDEWITSGCPSWCSTCPSELLCPDDCAFGSFLSSGSCTTCAGSCSPYGCRSTETCRLCQYRECTACTLFDGPCTACITNAGLSGGVCSCNTNAFWVASTATCELCDALCSTCTGTYYFLCSSCSGSAVLVGSVCLNACPYGFATSPCTSVSTTVIDQTFDTSFLGTYGIFTTSSSASTYQFWNSPDSLDPVPAYKRGLYFTGGQYLVSNTNIYLSSSVSMGLWIYVITAGDVLQKQTRLSLSSAGVVTATLENPSQTTTSASTTALSAFTGWTYLSFTITYTNGATTMTAYKNGAAGTTLTNTAYLYRDAASDVLYLGKSSTSSTFVGFIYYFSLWNTAITDFSSKFTIPCSTSLDTTCLWSCAIGQYYATSSCTSCNSCGNLGCRRAISCSICDDPLCSQCSGFEVNLCNLCVNHASGGSTTPCTCDTNYIASTDGFSCIWACVAGCAGCSGTGYYQCTSCLASYYYLNGLCLTSCPTGYTQDSTNHQCTLSLSTPVSLALQDLIQLNTVSSFTVGSSSANSYPSWTDSTDPVPSIYRGYYFTSSSLMSLSSLTITPFYTLSIWVKASAQGNLFLKLNGSTEVFKIVFTSSGWPTITVTLQDSSTVSLSGSTSLFNNWHNIAFTGDIISGNTKIYFYTDGSLISSQTSANVSPFIDTGSLYLGYSNSANGFTGFLWSVKVFNDNSHYLDEWLTTGCTGTCSNCPSELICPDDCGFGSFYSSGSCTTCAGSCSPHGCRSTLTCRLCQNKECTTCTLFDGACTACITNAGLSGGVCSCNSNAFWIQSSETCEICDNLCSTCLKTYYFECSICTGTKVLVDTVCLNDCPYTFTSSPSCVSSTSTIIDQSFDTAFQGSYGILRTSSSASTYQFFTSPDTTDPVPSYARGLYFSGSQYLQANVNIYMNYQFSVGLWIYKIADGDVFQKQARITLASNGIANIILESPSQTTTTVTTSSLTLTGWSYLSLTVSYLPGSTTIFTSLNNVAGTPIVSTNLLFRDVSSDILYVGKSTSSGFNGFIYYFSIWNTAISDFSSKLSDPCGSSLSASCLWSCDISHYYDGTTCQSCNSCALGCTQGVSCNICNDHLCSTCSGFASGLCTQCVNHASGGGATACSCNINYTPATDGFSCVWGCTTGCGGCQGANYYYQCTSCLTMYYFISGLCISVCPTGYTQDSTNNQCTLVSNLSFNLQFQDLIQLDAVNGIQVGSSSTNTYPTFESTDPVPSIYRGYYFNSNSYLTSTNLILNTYFTVTIWVNPTASGYLMLKINGSDEMFKISLSSGGIPTLMIILQDLSTVSVSGATNLFNGWHNIAFTSDIVSGNMKINLYTDGVLSASQLSANASPFIDLGNLKLGASSGSNGFTGFLWSLKVFNSNSNYLDEWKTTGCASGCSSCPSELICPDNCNFGSFYSSGCTTCDSSCSPYGCRSSLTCRLCLQKECKECTLFDGPCTSCIDRATLTTGVCACDSNAFWVQSSQTCEYCDALCTQCAGNYYFLCSACTVGETRVGNICLHECPYGFGGSCSSVSSQVITQSFDQNFAGSYGIFTTATSSSSYQFFNSPETYDPIPAKKRGLYFSSGKYLQSSVNVYLSYSFSLGFWAYVESAGDIFEKQNRLIINSSGSATIILESPSLATSTVTTGIISSSGWSYYSITISYSSGSTTSTVYINNVAGTSSSTSNYIFRDVASQTILIGKSTSSSFSGFIYNFNLWNSPITDFSTQVNNDICGTGLGSSCLWACGFGLYQNTGGSCSTCNSCSLGCVRGVSCNVCDDKLCSVCTGFGSNLCTTCVAHASGSVCSCDIGYYLSSDGFSCVVCSTGCSACTGLNYYQCTSCMSSYYYINNLCEPSCPTGYTQNSATHNCDLSSSLALYLNLNDQLRLDTVSGFSVGSDSTNTYPSWDTYDPVPAIQRGYYFTGSSYMTSSFKFSPNFSLSSWIKGLNDGFFLTKYDTTVYLSISFTSGIPTLTINLLDGTGSTVSGISSIFNSWSFFSFSGQILSDGTTKIISYVDGVQVNFQISGTSSFFRDSASGSLILGADQTLANGFQGYIWNLKIYNDNTYAIADWIVSGCGNSCVHCPADLTCLSDCSLATYPSPCTSCKAACTHGCVSDLTCRLCKAKECLSCNTFSGACLSCIPNASLSGTTCQCNTNALWVDSSESCELCNSACASCSSLTFASCIACSSARYLFENLCIKYCPTGYSKSGNKCIVDSSEGYIYNLKPNQIKDEVIDLQSGIATSTGNDTSFYPNYQESDPYAAQYRGYYFNGTSYMSVNSSSKALVLAPKFTISLWLNPASSSCDLFTKQSNSTSVIPILKVSLSSLTPSLKIKLSDGSTVLYTSINSLNQNQWNLIVVSSDISATPAQIISFSINAVSDISNDLGVSWFEDLQDSFKITIGSSYLSSSTLGNYFSGFLWDLKIRNKIVNFSSLYSTTCSQCSLCPVDNSGACIPNCPISQYWDGTQCTNCDSSCSVIGCVRNDKTCNLCSNVICSICDDFISGSCLQCKENSYLSSGECICNNGYYLNQTQEECLQCKSTQYSVNGICKNCPSLCTSCYDLSVCYTCTSTAELSQNSSCICKIGYNGTNCEEAYFDAYLAVNDDNSLNLTFSENLVNIISEFDLSMNVENISLTDYSWTMERMSDKFYTISLSFSVEVNSKTPIAVKLLNLTYFVSETNALLKDDTLVGVLYHYNPYSSSQAVSAVTSQTTAAVQAIIGTSVAVSFINPNPASLWSMLNTLNYIAYLGLTKIPMTESFYAFVINLNGNYYLPNLFAYVVDESQGTSPYNQAIKYGYDTDLILLNVGSAITTLGAIVAALPLVYFLSNCSQRYLARKLAGLLKNYKWSVFVRFWIQSYLDFTAAALIGLLNVIFYLVFLWKYDSSYQFNYMSWSIRKINLGFFFSFSFAIFYALL